MLKFKNIFICFLLFFSAGFAFGNVYNNPAKLETISKQLPEFGSIKCKFKQEKHLKNISKPVISSGDFEFIKNKGVYFYIKYPIESTVNYTDKNYHQVNDIINAISSKKYSKIEKEFNLYFINNKDEWFIGMKPKKDSAVYTYITSITINGKDYIRQIKISQTNGNETVIWFTK